MIRQSKKYIQTKKKKFLNIALICGAFIVLFMLIGLYLTKERVSLFTLLAGFTVIPCAQNLTRFLSFNRFKDPDEKRSVALEVIKGNLSIYHSAILIQGNYTLYAEHIVITPKHLYFLCEKQKDYDQIKKYMVHSLLTKGIGEKEIKIERVTDEKEWNLLLQQIEKEANLDGNLKRTETIIEGILM